MRKGYIVGMVIVLAAAVIAALGVFFFSLRPVSAASSAPQVVFRVSQGERFRDVANALAEAGLIRSPLSFDIAAVLNGRAGALKAGSYHLSSSMSTSAIIAALAAGAPNVATVTIPEGSDIFAIDRILSAASVTSPGAFARYALAQHLEGRLFPDTYQFYVNESPSGVAATMTKNFNTKAAPILLAASSSAAVAAANANEARNIIIASIVEKEVPGETDQEIVAGIILKRLAMGMPLDIDATVCYAKSLGRFLAATPTSTFGAGGTATGTAVGIGSGGCTLSSLDFAMKSPYNTYLYKGLPPGPIGNPGISAITAALHPQASPYLYYLTDPKTGKTIFAKTLDEQNQNRVKYLESD
jgi:UPF0755 protein